MRALTASMVLPVGSPPHAIGASISPVVRESSMRLLIGFLRIYDLIEVRGVTLEEGSQDLLGAVSTLLEPPQGEHETSRAAEIARWQGILGTDTVEMLRREAAVAGAYQLYTALLHLEVPQNISIEVLDECCAKAFPGERSPIMELNRYMRVDGSTLPSHIASRIQGITGGGREATSMIAPLSPLLASVEEDLSVVATLAKHSLGI
jgi:hypothetical protein